MLRKITQDIPTVSINRADIYFPTEITLADPEFLESSRIDMFIGVEIFRNVMCIGQIKITETQPYWQKTHLGWIASVRNISSRQSAEIFRVDSLSIYPSNSKKCRVSVNL